MIVFARTHLDIRCIRRLRRPSTGGIVSLNTCPAAGPVGFSESIGTDFGRGSVTSLLFFVFRLHTTLLQQDSFDPSTAFGDVYANSARATRAARCSIVLIDQSLSHVPAFFCVATG